MYHFFIPKYINWLVKIFRWQNARRPRRCYSSARYIQMAAYASGWTDIRWAAITYGHISASGHRDRCSNA